MLIRLLLLVLLVFLGAVDFLGMIFQGCVFAKLIFDPAAPECSRGNTWAPLLQWTTTTRLVQCLSIELLRDS